MFSFYTARPDPNPECVDYCGNKRAVGEKYLAPDGCSVCTCTEVGSGCFLKPCDEGKNFWLP